jgi:hypothetical protein
MLINDSVTVAIEMSPSESTSLYVNESVPLNPAPAVSGW